MPSGSLPSIPEHDVPSRSSSSALQQQQQQQQQQEEARPRAKANTNKFLFTYDAFMDPDIVYHFAGERPVSSRAGWISGFSLTFDRQGLPLVEPVLANMTQERVDEDGDAPHTQPHERPRVHGVLHEFSKSSMLRVVDYGKQMECFAFVPLRVNLYGPGVAVGETEAALAMVCHRSSVIGPNSTLLPSAEYVLKLVRLAKRFRLADESVYQMRTTPVNPAPLSLGGRVAKALMSFLILLGYWCGWPAFGWSILDVLWAMSDLEAAVWICGYFSFMGLAVGLMALFLMYLAPRRRTVVVGDGGLDWTSDGRGGLEREGEL
ncbi:unnamed protein product [Vitrella brassicaformis CCMP3155]|uniref:Uncharacterized protein n=1 Tax=Vitrella brassicaformis (strain CCMP3155) TaxID=1169540 RepID=A0A0G4EKP4_VITBC|nr:unnamed protein product [Vitrella brassicaformis CCMP3155]|eukprot:CEL97004.1 unnamed protein product [Vitrella brassicaformis CCMP3155]